MSDDQTTSQKFAKDIHTDLARSMKFLQGQRPDPWEVLMIYICRLERRVVELEKAIG